MNIKAWLSLLLFFGWSGFSWWWLKDKKAACCNQSTVPTVSTTETTKTHPPLYFNWSSDEPKQGDGFAQFKNEKISNLGPSDTLVITTWYYTDEANGESLALQRAEKLKTLFSDVAGSRVKIVTERRDGNAELKTADFEAASFTLLANQNSLVKKSGDKILIYFATNSSAKNLEKEIDDYLTTLAADMKNNAGIKVIATGYTDNIGNDARNLQLSKSRAEFVKAALIKKGVDDARVATDGKGKENPIAANDTDDGRRQNRRVELTITNQ